jgi:hypothetical protein
MMTGERNVSSCAQTAEATYTVRHPLRTAPGRVRSPILSPKSERHRSRSMRSFFGRSLLLALSSAPSDWGSFRLPLERVIARHRRAALPAT